MLGVALAILSPDNHLGTRLQASATELGGLVWGILLGGLVLTLALLATPSSCGASLVGCHTHTAVLCVLGVAALGLLVANRAVVGPPYPAYLWLGGLLGILGYGLVLIAGEFTTDLGVLWRQIIGHLLLMSLLGTGTCALVSALVLPSLATDEMRADTAAAIRGIAHAASRIASRALGQHDSWRAPGAQPAPPPPVARLVLPLPPPEPRPQLPRRLAPLGPPGSAADHRHPPSDLPPISEGQLTPQPSAAAALPELAPPVPPPATDPWVSDGQGLQPIQPGVSLGPSLGLAPNLQHPQTAFHHRHDHHHQHQVYHQHRLYQLGPTPNPSLALAQLPLGSPRPNRLGPAPATRSATDTGMAAGASPSAGTEAHQLEGLHAAAVVAAPPLQPSRSRRLPGVASCPALDELDGVAPAQGGGAAGAAVYGNDQSLYGDENEAGGGGSRRGSSAYSGYASSSSAASDDERLTMPAWRRGLGRASRDQYDFEEVMEDEDAFLRLLRDATAPIDPRVGGAAARQPPPAVAPPGGIRPSPSAFDLLRMPTTGVASSGGSSHSHHGVRGKHKHQQQQQQMARTTLAQPNEMGKGPSSQGYTRESEGLTQQQEQQQQQDYQKEGRSGVARGHQERRRRPHWRLGKRGAGEGEAAVVVNVMGTAAAAAAVRPREDEVVTAAAAAAVGAAVPGPGAGPAAAQSGGGLSGAAVAWAPVSAIRPLLARANACVAAAAMEPPWMCTGPCDLGSWSRVLSCCEVLVTRVAALECLLDDQRLLGQGGRGLLADDGLVAMLGADIVLPYRRVYGEVAASCAAMSIAVAESVEGRTRPGPGGGGGGQTHGSPPTSPFAAVGGWEASKQRLRGVVREAMSAYWARVRGSGPLLLAGSGSGALGGGGDPLLAAASGPLAAPAPPNPQHPHHGRHQPNLPRLRRQLRGGRIPILGLHQSRALNFLWTVTEGIINAMEAMEAAVGEALLGGKQQQKQQERRQGSQEQKPLSSDPASTSSAAATPPPTDAVANGSGGSGGPGSNSGDMPCSAGSGRINGRCGVRGRPEAGGGADGDDGGGADRQATGGRHETSTVGLGAVMARCSVTASSPAGPGDGGAAAATPDATDGPEPVVLVITAPKPSQRMSPVPSPPGGQAAEQQQQPTAGASASASAARTILRGLRGSLGGCWARQRSEWQWAWQLVQLSLGIPLLLNTASVTSANLRLLLGFTASPASSPASSPSPASSSSSSSPSPRSTLLSSRTFQFGAKYWAATAFMLALLLGLAAQPDAGLLRRYSLMYAYIATSVSMADRVESTLSRVALRAGGTVVGGSLGLAVMLTPGLNRSPAGILAVVCVATFLTGCLPSSRHLYGVVLGLITLQSMVLCNYSCCGGTLDVVELFAARVVSVLLGCTLPVLFTQAILPWYTSDWALEGLARALVASSGLVWQLYRQYYTEHLRAYVAARGAPSAAELLRMHGFEGEAEALEAWEEERQAQQQQQEVQQQEKGGKVAEPTPAAQRPRPEEEQQSLQQQGGGGPGTAGQGDAAAPAATAVQSLGPVPSATVAAADGDGEAGVPAFGLVSEEVSLQSHVSGPLVAVQTSLMKDTAVWTRGVYATPLIVPSVLRCLLLLADRLAALQLVVVDTPPPVVGRLSGWAFAWLVLPLHRETMALLSSLDRVVVATATLLDPDGGYMLPDRGAAAAAGGGAAAKGAADAAAAVFGGAAGAANGNNGGVSAEAVGLKEAILDLDERRLQVRQTIHDMRRSFHAGVASLAPDSAQLSAATHPDDTVRFHALMFALVHCLDKATAAARTALQLSKGRVRRPGAWFAWSRGGGGIGA